MNGAEKSERIGDEKQGKVRTMLSVLGNWQVAGSDTVPP